MKSNVMEVKHFVTRIKKPANIGTTFKFKLENVKKWYLLSIDVIYDFS